MNLPATPRRFPSLLLVDPAGGSGFPGHVLHPPWHQDSGNKPKPNSCQGRLLSTFGWFLDRGWPQWTDLLDGRPIGIRWPLPNLAHRGMLPPPP